MLNMEELLCVAKEVGDGKPKMGMKKKLWWPFIPLENVIVPLLHVMIGVVNDFSFSRIGLMDKLRV